jgi:hypothetical protein
MAEETELFNPLDSLGPEFGKINRPVLDSTGLSPFEGKSIKPQGINFPEVYYPAYPQPKTNLPNREIRENVVGNAPNPPGPSKKVSSKEFGDSYEAYINSLYQANQDKNVYSRIYSYDAGPSGNSFYKRYAAYGQKTFDKVGFHPLKNNEANFNAATTWWDDANRMLTHSFVPLLKNGFYSGPKSMMRALQGDFGGDLEDARMYEEAAAIGQSTKGGFGSFFNNTLMNFGYTAGIIGEAVVEEIAGAALAPITGGASFAFTTANNVNKASKVFKGFGMITDGAKAMRQSLKAFSNLPEARKFWEVANGGLTSKLGRVINPLENTYDALTGLSKADNLTNLAKISKTAGGFYRDVRNLNMALSEARLEAGMVENKVFDDLYNKHYEVTGLAPTDKDEYEIRKQAKEASTSTLYLNTGLIYLSNKITFDNITGPRGGVRNFLKSKTDDILAVDSGKFGSLGKVVYDKTKKAFEFQKNNLKTLAKSWYKDPLYKSAMGTAKYFKSNFSEGIQENLQEVIAGANERYYIDTFKSDARSSYEYSKAAIKDGFARQRGDYFTEELGKQFSGQGLETFASGFLMGTFAAPLNSAIPFLSTQYNRMFDKEAYNKWKTSKAQIAFGLINQLNDVNISEFLSDRVYNLGAQDIAAQIKRTGTKKEALDAENQAFVDSVSLMMNTGTIEQFKDKLGSYKEMTDEEFMDTMAISQDDVPKFRQRIDQSIQKLDKVKAKHESYTNKFPNPVDVLTLDQKDPDFYNKALLHHAWNKAVTNAVFFSETFDDVKQRMADIKVKYGQNKGFNTINSTDANAIFKPDAVINQVGLFETELEAERANPKPNAKRIKALEDKIASLNEFSKAYEGFNRFFSRGQYAGEVIAELKKELGTDPTQEQIIERMDQQLGSVENEELALPYIEALRNSHHKYLKTLGLEQEEIMFDEDLDAGFEQLLDFYKLNDEYKEVAKYVEALNNPENFIDLVDRNSAWMEKLYHNREEYYTKMVYDQISKVEANSLLNVLADAGLFINTEDFENYVNNGTPPSEIFNAPLNRVFKRGTEEYNQVYREYFVKMAELKETVAPKKSEFVNKDYQSKIDKLDADMKAEIDALPKDPETGEPDPKAVEKITNKYNKQKERLAEQFKKDKTATPDEEQEDYTFNFEGETISTKDKSIKDLRVYQDLINDRIKVLQQAKADATTIEEKRKINEQLKQFNKDSANIEKIIDAMTLKGYTPEQRKAIKAIQNLIKQQEGVEEGYVLTEDDPTTGLKKGDIAYRIKGLIHRRVTNAIREVESKDYKYTDANKVEDAYNKTIGKEGLNKTSTMNFMAKLRAEKIDGFNSDLYDELEEYIGTLEGKSRAQIEQEQYIYKLEQNLIKLDEKIAAADKDDNTKRSNLLRKQKDDLIIALEAAQSETGTTDSNVISNGDKTIPVETKPLTNQIKDTNGEYFISADKDPAGRIYINTEPLKDILVAPNNQFNVVDKKTGEVIISKELNKEGSVIFEAMQGRLFVVANINGQLIPFYKSSSGTDGKAQGDWYPFFGYTGNWLVKGGIDENGKMNYSSEIDNVTKLLNENLVFPDKYINRATNSIKNTDGSTLVDFNDFFKVNRLWQQAEGIQTGTNSNYTIEGLKENTRSESGLVALITGLNTTQLDSSDTPRENGEWLALLQNKIEGKITQETPDTTLDLIQKFTAERSYEDGRVAGNYVDDAKDYFEKGIKPEFDEKIITREAYDSLFGDNGYLTELKRKVDDRELYIVGRGLVVYDSDITREDGSKDRIAGEIDLVMADRKGNIFIVDLKTGSKSKWNNFNKVNRLPKDEYFSKRENYTLQQGAYARMLQNMIGYKAKVALLPVERTSDKETNQILTAGKPTSESIYKQLSFPKDENGNYVITERGEVDFDVDDSETKSTMFIPLYPDTYKKQLDKILPLKVKPNVPRVSLRPGEFEEGMDADEEFGAPFDAPLEPSEEASIKPEVNVTTKDVYDSIIIKYSATQKATQDRIEELKASLVPLSSTVSFANIDLADDSPFIVDQLNQDEAFAERFAFHEKLKENTSSPSSGQEEAVAVLRDSGILTAKELLDTEKKYRTMAAYSELIHEAVKRIQFLKTQSTDNAEIKALNDYQRQIFNLIAENKFLSQTKDFMSTVTEIEGAYRKGNARKAIRMTNDEINKLSKQASYKSLRPEEKKRLELRMTDLKLLRDTIIADEGLENALDDLKTVGDLAKEITTAMDLEKARKQLVDAIRNDLIITSENINYLNNLIKQREEQLANNEMPVMDETNIREGDIYIAKTNIFTSEKQKNPYIKLGGKVRVVSYDAATNTVTLVKDGGKRPKPYQVGLDEFNEQYMLEDVLNAAPSAPKYNATKDEKDLVKYSGEVLGDFLKDTDATAKAKADAEKQSMEDIDDELLDNLTCK